MKSPNPDEEFFTGRCLKHELDYDGFCPDCYSEWRQRDLLCSAIDRQIHKVTEKNYFDKQELVGLLKECKRAIR